MSTKKKKTQSRKTSPDGKVNLVTALINFIIALLNIIAIVKMKD